MKKLTMLLLVTTLATLFNNAFANRESGGRLAATAVFVEFTSFGTGIDDYTRQFTDSLINSAEQRGLLTDLEVQQRGREGEVYYCAHFKSASQRFAFIANLAKPIIHDSQVSEQQRTFVFVGNSCDERDSATEQDLGKYLRR